ncbi:Tat pathway signal protein [Rhizocola hellebori]|uniref:Tat pathway signal protein n=1 Tax=Rhizocola hellebori TaxID=1392758 RepID=A0A8J3QJR5_9ACTN|nr:PhoX family phosphatase [Rhizocola hellebori]GIH11327.1 Tat pathway signal protein [Rhizocola hellebori]
MDSEDISTNTSGNTSFGEVLEARLSRRGVMRTGTVVAAAGFFGAAVAAPSAVAGPADAAGPAAKHGRPPKPLLGFKAVAPNTADAITVPEGYTAKVLIPWGTPLRSNGPAWRKDASNTAAEQAQQIGMHHDGMSFFPDRGFFGSNRGLLVLNHEYVDTVLLYADGDAVITQEKVDKALAAHGVSVVAIEKRHSGWRLVDSRYNRRVTGKTPVLFSGPVSGAHPALAANGPAQGTLNNCSNGHTPWGTYVACEENWNGYFGTTQVGWTPTPEQARYGVSAAALPYRWHTVDKRFDVAENPNELNRFGWVVEIDPRDPHSPPVKRTALGRIKHEGATFTESRGRVVVYTGDDQNGEYIYKFVSSAPWRLLRAQRKSPLDHGTLYVGKFNDDGTGTWIPLVHGQGALTVANGWADQADVLIRTRRAADAVGATKLDRPEWVAVNPKNKDVYVTLTNGSGNGGAVNPRAANPYGHIIKWREAHGDNTSTSFEWDIFVLAGDPAYDATVTLGADAIFGSPDGLAFDDDGRMWIETDISNSVQNKVGSYDHIGNNQMLVADPNTGEIRRFLVGPRGAEITGWTITPDQRTIFVNVQHPGEATPFWGAAPTPATPTAVSNWPDFDPTGRPRSATVVITKNDGGIIGS